MNFNRMLIGNAIVLAILWAILLTYPALGFVAVFACFVLGMLETRKDDAIDHFISAAVGTVIWSFAIVWPITFAVIFTVIILGNIALIVWLTWPSKPMATRS